MENVKNTPTARLVADAAATLADYLASGRTRTDLLRRLASNIFDLRASSRTADGAPDWGGRSAEYRAAIHEVYSRARVPTADLDTVQAAIRYHLGNLLRDRVPASELEAAGLPAEAPRDQKDRARQAVKALSLTGSVAEVLGDPLRLLGAALTLLDHLNAADLRGMTRQERADARKRINALKARTEEISAALSRR